MFVLGIGKDVDPSELNQIASAPKNVFRVNSFEDLGNKANEAKRGICIRGKFMVVVFSTIFSTDLSFVDRKRNSYFR